jgi:hypothetical protein
MKRSEKLMQTIKEQDIRPYAQSRIMGQRLLLWSSFGIAVILGALAFSVILFAVQQADFSILQHLSHSRLELFLGLLPFLWLAFLAAFLLLAMWRLQRAPRGYKFNSFRLAAFSALLSILLGTAFFLAGGAQQLEEAFALRVSFYESVQQKKIQVWSMPEAGYLSGQVQFTTPTEMQLLDFQGQEWSIDFSEAFIPSFIELLPTDTIKIVGKPTGDHTFTAKEIRPWGGPRSRHSRNPGHR